MHIFFLTEYFNTIAQRNSSKLSPIIKASMVPAITFSDYICFSIDNSKYIAWPNTKASALEEVRSRSRDESILLTNREISLERRLVTAIPIKSNGVSTESQLIAFVEAALHADDVFHKAFLSGVIFYGGDDQHVSPGMQDYLSSQENEWTRFVKIDDLEGSVLPGPYILERGWLWQVSRLFEDKVSAFTTSLRKLCEYR